MWRAIGIRGTSTTIGCHVGVGDGQCDRHAAPRGDRRTDRPGEHAAGANARRLPRSAGGRDHGRVVRGIGRGDQHARTEQSVRLHTGGPGGLGSGVFGDRGGCSGVGARPELLVRVSEAVREHAYAAGDDGSVVDDDDPGTQENGVDLAERRRQ